LVHRRDPVSQALADPVEAEAAADHGRPAAGLSPGAVGALATAHRHATPDQFGDARMIASFVAIMPTRPAQPRAPALERLVEMLAVRRQISAEKVAAENAARLSRFLRGANPACIERPPASASGLHTLRSLYH
jgi:S-formylglutathione hydrolase FrmB